MLDVKSRDAFSFQKYVNGGCRTLMRSFFILSGIVMGSKDAVIVLFKH